MRPCGFRHVLAVVLVFCAVGGCGGQFAGSAATNRADSASGRTVVVWISIDGMRHDYVDRYQLPTLGRLMREGAYSRQLVPVFPSLTFPSHASEITGVSVRE